MASPPFATVAQSTGGSAVATLHGMALVARDLKLDLTAEIPAHWSPDQPEFSHVANAFMAALPQLEPYFMHNLRAAIDQLSDDDPRSTQLKTAVEGFNRQEARHAQQHRAWNQVLAATYPAIKAFDTKLKERLAQSRQRDSLAFRLAYTAGYEALTYQIVSFIVEQRRLWLQNADPRMIGLLVWHAAEEVEHKAVAYEVFQAVHGGYAMRVAGLAAAVVNTIRDIGGLARAMLEVDGLLQQPQTRRRLKLVRLQIISKILPPLWQYLMPSYDPNQHSDPPLIAAWLARYSQGSDLRSLSLADLETLAAS